METEVVKIDKLQDNKSMDNVAISSKSLLECEWSFWYCIGNRKITSGNGIRSQGERNRWMDTERCEGSTNNSYDDRTKTNAVHFTLWNIGCYVDEIARNLWAKTWCRKTTFARKFLCIQRQRIGWYCNAHSRLDSLVQQLQDVNITINDEMVITKLLMTLPDEYSHFSSA